MACSYETLFDCDFFTKISEKYRIIVDNDNDGKLSIEDEVLCYLYTTPIKTIEYYLNNYIARLSLEEKEKSYIKIAAFKLIEDWFRESLRSRLEKCMDSVDVGAFIKENDS